MYRLEGQRIYKGDNIVATFPTTASSTAVISVEEASELAKTVFDILNKKKEPSKPAPKTTKRSKRK